MTPPEGKHSPLIEFARWFNTGDPKGRDDYMRLLAMFEAQQTLNAKLVASLESVKGQIEGFNKAHNHNYFPGTIKEIEALLREAAK